VLKEIYQNIIIIHPLSLTQSGLLHALKVPISACWMILLWWTETASGFLQEVI